VAWSLLDSGTAAFADGNAGHAVSYTGGGPASGDLLVLAVASDTTVSTPSGWTLATSDVQQEGAYLFYRLAGAGESTSVTVTTNGDHNTAVAYLRYSGAAASSPLDVTDKAAATNSLGTATPTLAGATLAGSGELCVLAACLHGDDTGAATGATPSTGYTALLTSAMQGSGTSAAQVIVAGRTDGSGAQAPSVSWTKQFKDRTALFGAFLAGGGSTTSGTASLGVTAGQAATVAVIRPASATLAAAAALAGAGAVTANGAGTLTAVAALSVSAAVNRVATATLAVTATVAGVVGQPTTRGSMSLGTRRGPTMSGG
jgi:hypothetical protein